MRTKLAFGRRAILVVFLASLVLIPASQAIGGLIRSDNPYDDPGAASTLTYGDSGLTSRPAPPSAKPLIDEAGALSRVGALDLPTQFAPPKAALRLVSVDSSHGKPLGPGQSAIVVSERLAWVVVYPHSQMLLFGGIDLTDAERRQVEAKNLCWFVVALDASTGATLEITQACKGA